MNSKYALCFITNTLYANGVCVGIYSFLENNKWFDGDIVIIDYGSIDEVSRNKMLSMYNKLYFKKADDPRYALIRDRSQKFQEEELKKPVPTSIYAFPYIYKIEAFGLEGYDRVVFFDSDLLVFDDVRYLFDNDYDFAVCRDLWEDNYTMPESWRNPGDLINSGVMSIKSPSRALFEEVINEAINFEKDDIYKGLCYEQDSICKFFDKKTVRLLSFEYNFPQILFIYKNNLKVTTQKIVHYYGPFKPWEQDDNRADYINSFYRDTLKKVNEKVNKDFIDIFYIATGPYVSYFERFILSIGNFMPGFKKRIHVITDQPERFEGYNIEGVTIDIRVQTDLPYPIIPLCKNYFIQNGITDEMVNVFYFDADTIFLEKWPAYWDWFIECLNTGKMLFANHPKNYFHPYEINENSQAYIPKENFSTSVISSFYGGKATAMLDFCKESCSLIKNDLTTHEENGQKHYIPPLFDQDYANKYVNTKSGEKCIVRYFTYIDWFNDENDEQHSLERFIQQKYDISRKFEKKNMK